jgi:hypothetical protein
MYSRELVNQDPALRHQAGRIHDKLFVFRISTFLLHMPQSRACFGACDHQEISGAINKKIYKNNITIVSKQMPSRCSYLKNINEKRDFKT